MNPVRAFVIAMACATGLGSSLASAASNTTVTPHVEASLVSELESVRPGSAFWVGLRMQIRAGWHTYWRNPGDSGLAPRIDWHLPDGVAAGAIRWPLPHRFRVGSSMNYGYDEEVVLLTRVSVLPTVARNHELRLGASVQWLVCADICVPEQGELELRLPISDASGQTNDANRALLAKYAKAVPAETIDDVGAEVTAAHVNLNFALPSATTNVKNVWFYSADFGVIEHGAEQTWRSSGERLQLTLVRGDFKHKPLEELHGVLSIEYADGTTRGWQVSTSSVITGS